MVLCVGFEPLITRSIFLITSYLTIDAAKFCDWCFEKDMNINTVKECSNKWQVVTIARGITEIN
jgi:hypothetical protein